MSWEAIQEEDLGLERLGQPIAKVSHPFYLGTGSADPQAVLRPIIGLSYHSSEMAIIRPIFGLSLGSPQNTRG